MTTLASTFSGRDLLALIRSKHIQVKGYLKSVAVQRQRLVNLNLLTGGVSALLTAGPALGGKTLATWLSAVLGLALPAWQLLCGVAALSSLLATMSTQWIKSHQLDDRVLKAQALLARLEALEAALLSGSTDSQRAMADYSQCIESGAFMSG